MNMEVKTLSYKFWNAMEKDPEVDDWADEFDLCFYYSGYVFLLQTTRKGVSGFNNLMFQKFDIVTDSILNVFKKVQEYLLDNGIDFIRIEGNKKRYNWLKKYFDVVHDDTVADRNVFYARLR